MKRNQDASQRRATLADIAARAGVATSTVSRILIGEKTLSIRPETRERVLELARELSYRPNTRARSLQARKSFSVGLVIPEIDNPVFGAIIRGAQRVALERGYSLLIAYADKDFPDQDLYARLVEDNQVDGLLVTTLQTAPAFDPGRWNIPYVLVNRDRGADDPKVMVDYQHGTQDAVRHLAGLGHRSIAYVSGPLEHYTGRTRLAGYKAGLAQAGLPFDPSLVVECDYGRAQAESAMAHLLNTRSPEQAIPTAVCAANVSVAAGILSVLARAGIAVPRQMSVLALLDTFVADMLTPPVTAVSYPFIDLGRAAAAYLLDMIEHGRQSAVVQALPRQAITLRGSCGPAPAR
ncbi:MULTISPECIES: LacI family DNA-binding transcriptional regulator [unclassified Achromobacter]|uniref:LacI family DNA-binding transcriptional regulator n=1 Tax=unclassified Achromobacter TaxID=2626865 RepID=UPI000B51B57C|nr:MULTISPECIES: LacI family DNA-binding transcriptional regulator [unclassified Achromobacter]OWT80202.1 LacI family transcriptional regulator [Achromobacter sp. HZ34]OWT82085.1 LacI family transcriptional regulator [Achromobacter sp. HZ28]